ncbi:MAG: hypothetical protein IKY07_00730 [Clostridia bacterium]|nr:hypothetical protein [Clostridia bacterium]
MLKRLLAFVLIFALAAAPAIALTGCDGGKEPAVPGDSTAPADVDINVPENYIPVVGRDGALLGAIDSRASCSAADAGIFYSVFELENYHTTGNAEYRFFRAETCEDILLGTLEGQGYEAVYSRTELNGRIYTLAVKGTPGGESVPLLLLAFDPALKMMKTFTVSENGFPYADMAAVNGKLLIMNHETNGMKYDKLYEFDPASETVGEVLSFTAATDSLRGVCSAENGFYLLRLKVGAGGNEMFVDLYDNAFNKTAERSVNEALVNAIMTIPGMLGRQDALNEIGMNISHFSVTGGKYMFYENFGLSRVIVDLETGETLLAKEDLYSVSTGSGSPLVYRMDFDSEGVNAPEITGLESGKLVNFEFKPVDSHKLVRSVSRSNGGTWVVVTSDDPRSFAWTLAVHLWTEP